MKKESIALQHKFLCEYVDPNPAKSWSELIDNLIPTVGLDKILNDSYAAKSPDAAFAVGLITGPGVGSVVAGDTMASHGGWTENTGYSDAGRPSTTFGAPGAGSGVRQSVGSACVFNINSNGTIGGMFLVSGTAGTSAGQIGQKGGTGGTLRGAGAFSSGDKPVSSGGTLTVTPTATAQAV